MGAAGSIAILLWWRARWMLVAAIAYLGVLALAIQIFPRQAPIFCTATLALVFVWANLLTTFTFGPADFSSKNSGFPANMLVLPARVWALVGWPMLYGAVVSIGLWCVAVSLILVPGGVKVPIVWPALLWVACTVWTQAMAWTPFPSPWIRAPLLLFAVAPIVVLAIWGGMQSNGLVALVVTMLGLAWTLAAFLVGVRGVSQARSGPQRDWFTFFVRYGIVSAKQIASGPLDFVPFRSAAAAQLWHEIRRNAIALVAFVGMCSLPIFVAMMCLFAQSGQPHDLMFKSVLIRSEWLIFGAAILVPFMIAGMTSFGLGKFDFWGKDRMPAFFAVRPMTSLQFVKLKFKMAAVAAAGTWGVTVLLLATWVILDISRLNRQESLVRAAWTQLNLKGISVGVLCLVGLVFFLWRGLVEGFWTTMAGRKWVSQVVGVGAVLAFFLVLPAIGFWVYRHAEVREILQRIAPYIMVGILAIKLLTAGCLGCWLVRLQLAPLRLIVIASSCWLAVAGSICLIAAYYLPLTPLVAAVIALQVPAARIAAAPLALYWNRHR